MYIVKVFNYFYDAEEFENLLKKYGAVETRITAKWLKRYKEWTITVMGVFDK